jgi:hypothetical protein
LTDEKVKYSMIYVQWHVHKLSQGVHRLQLTVERPSTTIAWSIRNSSLIFVSLVTVSFGLSGETACDSAVDGYVDHEMADLKVRTSILQ